MQYKKVLITGGNGVLGTKLIAEGLGRYEILSVDLQPQCLNAYLGDFGYAAVDITQAELVDEVWENFSPELVIHAAAFTDVDAAEDNRALCAEVNILGTEHITASTCRAGAKLAYISTDYVFDGTSGPYGEDDEPNPLGWYGYTKYQGELAAAREIANLLICRTMGLYGFAPHIRKFNFVGWLIENLRQSKSCKVLTDQMVNHTVADDLARVIYYLAEHNASGVFNTAGQDRLSRYEFAMRLAQHFDFDTDLIKPVNSNELGLKATRPLEGGLKMDKLAKHVRTMDTEAQLQVIKQTFEW